MSCSAYSFTPSAVGKTASEINETYNATTPLLPSSSFDRDSTGMLTNTSITSIMNSLRASKVIPVAATSAADVYTAKVTTLIANIQSEFCFYDVRYKYALEQLFTNIKSGYTANTSDTTAAINTYLVYSKTLNQKLNDLTQIINAVTEDMLSSATNLEAEIKKFNKTIQEQREGLEKQNKIISSSNASTQLKKEMVKYTEEKARNSDNLLKLYSFLNIVTLGLLVYIYKAAN